MQKNENTFFVLSVFTITPTIVKWRYIPVPQEPLVCPEALESHNNENQPQELNMQISITGHHVDITQALRTYVESKFERLERHFDNMTNVHVILGIQKERKKAEATIHVSRGNLFADIEHEDMYAAIDGLVDKLDRQLKKYKEKLVRHRRDESTRKNNEAT